MKYAKEIIKEIQDRGAVATTNYITDKNDKNDDWENYMRGHKIRMTTDEIINCPRASLK